MRLGSAVLGGLVLVAACTPIEPVPLSNAPVNRCPCSNGATCDSKTNRCRSAAQGNLPGVPFYLVVHLPNTSYYGPGATFVLHGDRTGAPAFTRTATIIDPVTKSALRTKCFGRQCVELGGMTFVTNFYRTAADQSLRVRYPLADDQLIPARVEYELIRNATDTSAVPILEGLPVEPRFVAPRLSGGSAFASAALPSGRYRRIMYPQPPFDALFPPISEEKPFQTPPQSNPLTISDLFTLTSATLDPVDTRSVTVTRAEGLDGWQVWVADSATKRRISTLRTLEGTAQTLNLDTTGERRSQPSGGLGDDVEVVVAPPAGYIGVPRFINPVNGGDLGTIRYPVIYPPAETVGVVAEPDDSPDGRPFGYPAQLTFESATITTPREPSESSPLLHYSTTVSTDDSGRFATVLPPGVYTVTIEPLQGTRFAKSRAVAVVNNDVRNGFTFRPPRRSIVSGRLLLADGSPVAEATILATPETPTSAVIPKPRPSQTRTDREGRYSLELDQGPYAITAIPLAATGYPWVVTRVPNIVPGEPDLGDTVVPAPVIMSFEVRDSGPNELTVANALVRIFTVPGVRDSTDQFASATAPPVEIGNGWTDANGNVEILLAPAPP